jgi:hypothetical protein
VPFNGVEASTGTTRDGRLKFRNKRAFAMWKLREELDPEQEGGSVICLPPDPELKADLASARWKLTLQGIQIEDKGEIKKRIGRSPDKGDAVVMAMAEGQAAQRRALYDQMHGGRTPQVVVAYSKVKRRH